MTHYPYILIPERIKKLKTATPSLPPFDLKPPIPPSKPQPVFNGAIVTKEAALVSVPGGIAVTIPQFRTPGLVLLGISALYLGLRFFQKAKQQKKNEQQFRNDRKSFLVRQEMYENKAKAHQQECDRLTSPEYVEKFRQSNIMGALQSTQTPFDNQKPPRKGYIEGFSSRFRDTLFLYFPGKIYENKSLQNPQYSPLYPYTADFAYIDYEKNLHIDIEVDEPYIWTSLEPIHCIEEKKEQVRNQFFLSQGWIVIRFSEEQAVLHPDSCCKEIANVIASFDPKATSLDFASIPSLQKQRRWTRQEAQIMAKRSYREFYLPPSNN